MRLFKVTLATLVVCLVSVPLLSCGSESDETASETQLATVQRGDLSVEITAVGNLALSQAEDMAIDLFYYEGTVEEVLVEEGDTVEEGQELIKLDTSEWNDELRTLEKALVTAQRKLTTEESDLLTAERAVADKELLVRQAELTVQSANNTFNQTEEVKKAYDNVKTAELEYQVAQLAGDWRTVAYCQEALADAREELRVVTGSTSDDSSLSDAAVLAFETAKLAVEQKQRDLEDTQIAVEDANLAVYYAQLDKEDAEQDVADAQEDLDEAKALSPIITAPFDGFITKVNVEGGDEVLKGTVAVQIADPNKFEAEIMVSELDIFDIELGGSAWVEIDALDDLSLPATVTYISPTATVSSGVVNYTVKVEVESLEDYIEEQEAAMQEAMESMQAAMQAAMEDVAAGELPDNLKQAVEEGQLTQEEAEEMVAQMQQGMPEPEEGTGQAATSMYEEYKDYQLKEGLTITVTLVVDETTDALLIPNEAVTTWGQRTYVQVMADDGTIEEREITPGISDWQYTEVTEGLSEGEQVVVPEGTATVVPSTTEEGQGPPGGGMMMPMMGGGPR